jgi:AcrR family transcriptional regulator
MARAVQLPAPGRGAYDRSLTRPERDAEHRERLLLAAADVLARGPATVARIVERAGVGRSTFYEFFDSPEHVMEALEQRTLRAFELELERAFEEARTPLERVRAIVRHWLNQLQTRPETARFALTRRVASEPLSPLGELLRRTLERCAQAARQEGMPSLKATDELSLLAAAAAVEALSRRHLAGPPLPDAQRTLVELVTKLLR